MKCVLRDGLDYYVSTNHDNFGYGTKFRTSPSIADASIYHITVQDGKLVIDKELPEGSWSIKAISISEI
jgi:hypothetical protein